jgi:8-oxo-dGTP pyrophosphatase MutT (NUDIX family)
MLKKWETISQTDEHNLRIFRAVTAKRKNPKNGDVGEFSILKSNNWANIPITDAGKVVFVKQYRHGTDSIELELPGGMIEKGETPGFAAIRECEEETGYSSENPVEFLGEMYPNPAFLNNRCYTFLWRNCSKKIEQNLDRFEDIELELIDEKEIPNLILSGRIRHGVIITALNFLLIRKR